MFACGVGQSDPGILLKGAPVLNIYIYISFVLNTHHMRQAPSHVAKVEAR